MLELEIAPKAAQETPRRPQERQEAAKRRQDSAEKRQEVPRGGQERFRSHLGSIWDPPGEAKNHPTPLKKQRFSRFSLFSKGSSKRGPKSSKRRPPGGQNAPRKGPGAAQEAPRSRQKRPRSTPRAAQEAKKRSKKGDHLRFRSWGGSGRPPGAVLKRFGSDFRASGVAF